MLELGLRLELRLSSSTSSRLVAPPCVDFTCLALAVGLLLACARARAKAWAKARARLRESARARAMIIGQRISPWLEPDTGLGLDAGLSS